jgi:hypothetical protein
MATLHQYYKTDFSNAVRMYVRFSVEGENIEAIVLEEIYFQINAMEFGVKKML